MNGKFIILGLLLCLSLGWTGCTEDSTEQAISEAYNARLIARLSVKTGGLEVDTPVSRANADETVLSDMWYAIFNTATGKLVPSVKGDKIRHQALAGKQLDFEIEEDLPGGNYTVAFLVMAEGGDASAVQSIESLNDTWLAAGEEGIVAGDFFHGQGMVAIASEETVAFSVELTRVSGLFSFTTEMADKEQQQFIREIGIVLNRHLPYSAMSVDGKMIAADSDGQQVINITDRGGSFFTLVPKEESVVCEGNIVVVLVDNTQRVYKLNKLLLERGKRTTYTLNLNLPFNRLVNLNQSAIIGERGRMLKTGESQASMLARHFKLQNPLTVTFNNDKSSATLQYYSPVGIGHTDVYARIKSTQDYFKVYELDTIRPFDEIKMEASLFNNEDGYYLTEKGGIIKIPAGINLSNNELEYKTVCKSDYWKMIESIGINPTIRFNSRDMGGDKIDTANQLTPRRARFIVGILLNWGVMLTSPTFMEALDEWPDLTRDYGDNIDVNKGKHEKFYWTDPTDKYYYPTPEEIKDRIYNVFGKSDLRFGVHKRTGNIGGLTTSEYISMFDVAYVDLFRPYKGTGYYVYHELAHAMGYPDSYTTGHTTMAPADRSKGWTDLCELIHSYMCSRNELPFSSPDILDTIEE